MTTPLSSAISSWLMMCPGPIKAKTEAEVYSIARQKFADVYRISEEQLDEMVPMTEFVDFLRIKGYTIEIRTDHSTKTAYPMLALPHRHVGS